MLNPAFGARLKLVDMAMHGVVRVTMKSKGKPFSFECTLLPNSLECANMNSETFYATPEGKAYKKAKADAKKNKPELSWEAQLDNSINLLYVVDRETFSFRRITMRALMHFEPVAI